MSTTDQIIREESKEKIETIKDIIRIQKTESMTYPSHKLNDE